MRIDAYNAVSQVYRSNSTPVVKKADNNKSFSDKLEISQTGRFLPYKFRSSCR